MEHIPAHPNTPNERSPRRDHPVDATGSRCETATTDCPTKEPGPDVVRWLGQHVLAGLVRREAKAGMVRDGWLDAPGTASGDVRALAANAQLGDVLAGQRASQVPKEHGIGLLGVLVRVRGRVDREDLVVAEGVDRALGKKAGVVHGAMVDDLNQGVVLVGDGGVVDVDQAVGAAGQDEVLLRGMILKLSNQSPGRGR